MAENSEIEWTTHTFNPWVGCTKVSAGCANCYAERDWDKRRHFAEWGPAGTRVVKAESGWREPLRWDRATREAGRRDRVFCASLADVFEGWSGSMSSADGRVLVKPHLDSESQPENWELSDPDALRADPQGWRPVTMGDVRRRLFDLIYRTPNLDWLLLTKRPENAARMMGPDGVGLYAHANGPVPRPQPNLWIGTSVEDQKAADDRIPHLLRVPAAVRFLSCEPLLGPVDLSEWMYTIRVEHNGDGDTQEVPCRPDIHWVVVGGESGPGARPMHPHWARSLRDQCQAAGVPFHFKQWGEFGPDQVGDIRFTPVSSRIPMDEPASLFRVGKKAAGRLLDGRTWDELPAVAAAIGC